MPAGPGRMSRQEPRAPKAAFEEAFVVKTGGKSDDEEETL